MTRKLLSLLTAVEASDVLIVAGVLLMAIGAAVVYWPAGLVVPGIAFAALGIWRAV